MIIHIDFETRSDVSLPAAGLHKYCEGDAFAVLCMGWAIDDGPVSVWVPPAPFPQAVIDGIKAGAEVWAHNAAFERQVWRTALSDIVPIDDRQWRCTAVMAAAAGLPRALDDVARALRIPQQKNAAGKALISACCIPPFDTAQLPALYDYCAQDVVVERMIGDCLAPMSEDEVEDQVVNFRLNDVGIPIDRQFAAAAARFAEEERAALADTISRLTHGELSKTSGSTVTKWVFARLDEAGQAIMLGKTNKPTLDKVTRTALLELEGLPELVRAVLQCTDDASSSSVAKYQTMLNRSSAEDWRVRGCYLLNGAPSTGRFSSTGVQLHNFPRKTPPRPTETVDLVVSGRPIESVMTTLSHMLRPTILAEPGKVLLWADWSAIEGRVLPWLTGKPGEKKLNVFREGKDPYIVNATGIFNVPYDRVTPNQRQAGKVAELALGFGGGVGALNAMGANYGLHFSEEEGREVVRAWRRVNSWAEPFWNELEAAAFTARRYPGEPVTVGRVTYEFVPGYLHGALLCTLPSGRTLTYPEAKVEVVDKPWGPTECITSIKGGRKPRAGESWPRVGLWRGLLAENITQACAADLLRDSLRWLVLDDQLPVIGHTHDEIVLELPEDQVAQAAEALHYVMTTPPAWAEGLPLKTEVKHGVRYGK